MTKELPPKNSGLSRREPRAEDQRPDKTGALSEDDEAALAAFCEGIHTDEISFSAWRELHHSLDLVLDLKLTAAEAQAGGEREVEFVRSIRAQAGAPRRKERVLQRLRWPSGVKSEHVIILTGQGDRCGEAYGSVRVRLLVS